ncbi:MAG: aminopeptidase P family protein, partial [Ruminococcaceae bacterium]|nr:aminopeptidase P family protein [Oscillospiraceae bacterium]
MTRIEKLRKTLGGEWEAALVMNAFNRAYLCGVDSSDGVLMITPKKAYLIIDSRFIEVAKRGAEKGIEVILMEKLYVQLAQIASDEGVGSILIEDQTPVGELAEIKRGLKEVKKFVCDGRLSDAIARLRAVKDEGELSKIRAAQKITDAAFNYILGFIETGMTERRVAAELE